MNGVCQCGCGRATPIATETRPSRGYVKGQPKDYVRGHSMRRRYPGHTVDAATGCWNWNGYVNRNGYGGMCSLGDGRVTNAHRAMYIKLRGEIPEGMQLDHLCRNRRCVNPDHLEVVTARDNTRRAPRTRMTGALASQIRKMAVRGMSHESIAAEVGFSRAMVSLIVAGKRWAA